MRIAICDDDIRFAGKIEELLGNCAEKAECDVFLSAEELLRAIGETGGQYQMYVLDIEMKEMNGMEAAAKIRETDQNALIIFMTSHVEKMPEAFDVGAFHYLIKPIDEAKAREVFLRAICKLEADKKFFTFQAGRQNYIVAYENIRYFESQGRKVRIHTEEKEYDYYGTLKEVMKSLEDGNFVQVHQAYIVNLDYIANLDREQVQLRGDVSIPISRTYRKEFLSAYQKYVIGMLHP